MRFNEHPTLLQHQYRNKQNEEITDKRQSQPRVRQWCCMSDFSFCNIFFFAFVPRFHQDLKAMSCQLLKAIPCECLCRFSYAHSPTRSTLITVKSFCISWHPTKLWCFHYEETVSSFKSPLCVFVAETVCLPSWKCSFNLSRLSDLVSCGAPARKTC